MLRFPRLGQKNPCKFCLSLLEHWLLRKPAATDKKSDFPEMSRPHGEERERLLYTIIQGLWPHGGWGRETASHNHSGSLAPSSLDLPSSRGPEGPC